MLKMSDVVQMRLFKKYQMDIDSPHILSFLHPFSSVGKKEGLAFGVYISIFFFCFSFELMCSRLGLSKETCVESFSGFPASTISLTFDNIPFPSSVSYPPPHPFQISPFSLPPSLCPSNPIRPQMLGSAIFIFSTVRVCAQVSSLSRRCTCV